MKQSELDFTNFIRDLAVDALKPEQQAHFLERIMQIVHNRVWLRLSGLLADEQKQQLMDAEQRGGTDAMFDELEQLQPEYLSLYQEELDGLHQEMTSALSLHS